jgi:hypothetical protein
VTINIDKALIAAFQAGEFLEGDLIGYENKPLEPNKQGTTAELLILRNPRTPLGVSGSDEVTGIFRIILRTPINIGAVAIKELADEIVEAFKPRTPLEYEGQHVIVTSANRRPGVDEPGKYKQVVDVTFIAFIPRGN